MTLHSSAQRGAILTYDWQGTVHWVLVIASLFERRCPSRCPKVLLIFIRHTIYNVQITSQFIFDFDTYSTIICYQWQVTLELTVPIQRLLLRICLKDAITHFVSMRSLISVDSVPIGAASKLFGIYTRGSDFLLLGKRWPSFSLILIFRQLSHVAFNS